MKKILITGGAGFIGSRLALHLLQKGHTVTVLDNLSPQIHGDDPENGSPLFRSIQNKVHFIRGTVTSRDDWQKAIVDNEVIVHLAAETGTGQSMYQVHHYVDTNIGGTGLLLDILANTPTDVKKIVVASSRAIYGEGKYMAEGIGAVYPEHRTAAEMDKGNFEVTWPGIHTPLHLVATDEESKLHPSSVYGITKLNQEQLVMVMGKSLGIAPVAFRYQNVYGPGQSLSNPYTGILSIFSGLILQNKPINIFEDGKESRDFVFIDDVVRATAMGIENEEADGQVFNVGTGVPTSVLEVAQALCRNYDREVPLNITGNYRLGDIRHNYADMKKIQGSLGFRPSVSFAEGLRQFTDWVSKQSIGESKYEQSLREMKEKGLFK